LANPHSRKPHVESGTIVSHQDVATAHVISGGDNGHIANQPGGDIGKGDLGGRARRAADVSQPFIVTKKSTSDINMSVTSTFAQAL
jgi:hypothetical protein